MKIFITGATGYIGGSVAARLIKDGHRVVGLARTDAAAEALRQRGIEPYAGGLNDHGRLRAVAGTVDAVINAASSDNAFVVRAILRMAVMTGAMSSASLSFAPGDRIRRLSRTRSSPPLV